MANGDAADAIHWFHTIWSALITGVLAIAGFIVKWNWEKINDEVDKKADKTDLLQLRTDLTERWQRQDTMHSENRRRLDDIYNLLLSHSRRNPGNGP